MTLERDHLSKADTLVVAVIEENLPTLVEARAIIADFHLFGLTRKKWRDVLPFSSPQPFGLRM
jgi:hypothetical protein